MTGQQKHDSVIDSVAEWGQESQYSKEESNYSSDFSGGWDSGHWTFSKNYILVIVLKTHFSTLKT